MNAENHTTRKMKEFVETYRNFTQARLVERAEIELPENYEWLKEHHHAYILAILRPLMSPHSKHEIIAGRSIHGPFIAVENDRGEELACVTFERTKRFRSGPEGVLLPCTDSAKRLFDAFAEDEPLLDFGGNYPFRALREGLIALEHFGGDDAVDCRHVGTFFGHETYHSSRVTEVFLWSTNYLTLSYTPLRVEPDPYIQKFIDGFHQYPADDGEGEDDPNDMSREVVIQSNRNCAYNRLSTRVYRFDDTHTDGTIALDDSLVHIRPLQGTGFSRDMMERSSLKVREMLSSAKWENSPIVQRAVKALCANEEGHVIHIVDDERSRYVDFFATKHDLTRIYVISVDRRS